MRTAWAAPSAGGGLTAAAAEGLFDRQAAEAVRGWIDWRHALALPLADPGFDSTVLSEFRSRLVETGPSATGTVPWMIAWHGAQPAARSAPGP